MGNYTEFHFNVTLIRSVPNEVLDVLRAMMNLPVDSRIEQWPNHPLFSNDYRWAIMLCSDSYYFSADTSSTLRFDDTHRGYYLCIRCNLKNYGDEIRLFVDWITPYLDHQEGDFLGFSRYEESEDPDLIHHSPSDITLTKEPDKQESGE